MKNELIIGFLTSLAVLISLVYFGREYYTKAHSFNNLKPVDKTVMNNTILSFAEVGKHNTQSNCWIIIQDKVYDVSNYLDLHPGGSSRITPFCGKDATQPFLTQGGKGSHSTLALEQLGFLYLGNMNSRITNQPDKTKINSLPIFNSGRGVNDD